MALASFQDQKLLFCQMNYDEYVDPANINIMESDET